MNPVDWSDKARDQLADIWVQATPDERTRIEGMVLAVERDLADDPHGVGKSRGGRLRFVFRNPLSFWFEVSASGDRVRIGRVLRPRRRQ
jgi:plasmid stabilization system protein ParE